MFWINLLKKYFLGLECDSENSSETLQLIMIGWGAEREVLPIQDFNRPTR
ncbi:MAG: hypothetical protein SWJ54_13155 [Cyanobacteriota bacterium]|nr:hypothetical protein [Cyanobacteriota bacterium]